MNRPGIETFLTVEQVAVVLRVGPGTVRRLVAQRRIRFLRVGRQVRIPESGLQQFIAAAIVEPLSVPEQRRIP